MSDVPLSQQPTMINLQARASDALDSAMVDFPGCTFIIIAVTFAAMALFYGDPLLTRTTANGRLEAQSIGDRGNQYSDAMALFANHPFTGVGKFAPAIVVIGVLLS